MVFSGCGCVGATVLDPKSASKSTAAGLVVIGGDRGEGKVTGWAVGIGGRAEEERSECVDTGRCNGCV